jgi:hypothetical protein
LAALLLAAGLAGYPAATAHAAPALVAVIGTLGVLFVLAALLAVWEDGLVAGPALLLVAYTLSLTSGREPLSRSAPVVAAGLLALVDLGSWSLELRDGAEQRPFAHLRTLVLLTAGGTAASVLVLALASVSRSGGLALWLLGAAAALGLVTLIGHQPAA